MVMPRSERDRLRGGFNDDALAYDRTRPVCPAELFDDLVALTDLTPGKRVLEIGAGTGQASLPLAQRGLAITALELGPELAELAREKLVGFDTVEVVTRSFEAWEPPSRPFDAVVACNSLHWIDPELRYTKPAAVLRPGGYLIVAGCKWSVPGHAQPFWRDVQEDYRAVGAKGDPPPTPGAIGAQHLPVQALTFFEEVAARRYPFTVEYTTSDYLANLGTQTVSRELDKDARARFLTRVEARLSRLGSPNLTATFVGLLTVGRLRTEEPAPA
jgi:SAM-dependent methyltransferase